MRFIDRPSSDSFDLRAPVGPRQREPVLHPVDQSVKRQSAERAEAVPGFLQILRISHQEVLLEEHGHQFERQQRGEQVGVFTGFGLHRFTETIDLGQPKPGSNGVELGEPIAGMILGAPDRLLRQPGAHELVDRPVKPVAMEFFEFFPVTSPSRVQLRCNNLDA